MFSCITWICVERTYQHTESSLSRLSTVVLFCATVTTQRYSNIWFQDVLVTVALAIGVEEWSLLVVEYVNCRVWSVFKNPVTVIGDICRHSHHINAHTHAHTHSHMLTHARTHTNTNTHTQHPHAHHNAHTTSHTHIHTTYTHTEPPSQAVRI